MRFSQIYCPFGGTQRVEISLGLASSICSQFSVKVEKNDDLHFLACFSTKKKIFFTKVKNVNSKYWVRDQDTYLGENSASYDVGKSVGGPLKWKKKGVGNILKNHLILHISALRGRNRPNFFSFFSYEISNPDFQTACLYLFGKYANSRNRPRTDGK